MSLNPPSDVADVRASERQVAFQQPLETTQKTGNTSPDRQSPLVAAIKLASQHIQTLHYGLTTFLMTLTEQCLRAYSVHHHSSAKIREMRLNPTHVPNSIKKIRLTLQPLDEVKASKDYQALHSRLVTETEALHRKWATEYSITVDKWNSDALLRRCQNNICLLLSQAARGFIAQFSLRNYTEHEAIMDFLALYSSAVLHTPLPLDIPTFLRVYKDTNKLRLLPKPTLADQAVLNTMIDQRHAETYRLNSSHNTYLPTRYFLPTINTHRRITIHIHTLRLTCYFHHSPSRYSTHLHHSRHHNPKHLNIQQQSSSSHHHTHHHNKPATYGGDYSPI